MVQNIVFKGKYPDVIPLGTGEFNAVSAQKLLDDGVFDEYAKIDNIDIRLDWDAPSPARDVIIKLQGDIKSFVDSNEQAIAFWNNENPTRADSEAWEELLADETNRLVRETPLFAEYRTTLGYGTRDLSKLTMESEFDCEHLSFVTSVVMQTAVNYGYAKALDEQGIYTLHEPTNYYVMAGYVQFGGNDDRSEFVDNGSGHVWIQSSKTGNIIEATTELNSKSYARSLASGYGFEDALAGYSAMTQNASGHVVHYATAVARDDAEALVVATRKAAIEREGWGELSDLNMRFDWDTSRDAMFLGNEKREAAFSASQKLDAAATNGGDEMLDKELSKVSTLIPHLGDALKNYALNPEFTHAPDRFLRTSEWERLIVAEQKPEIFNEQYAIEQVMLATVGSEGILSRAELMNIVQELQDNEVLGGKVLFSDVLTNSQSRAELLQRLKVEFPVVEKEGLGVHALPNLADVDGVDAKINLSAALSSAKDIDTILGVYCKGDDSACDVRLTIDHKGNDGKVDYSSVITAEYDGDSVTPMPGVDVASLANSSKAKGD